MATTYLDSGREIPQGVIDGVNAVFGFLNAPLPVNSLQLYLNGILLPVGTQYDRSGLTPYQLSGNRVTLLSPPQGGDELVGYYSYAAPNQASTVATATANPIDLTTVDIVKSWLTTNTAVKSSSTPAEDANVQRCITAASRYWLWRTGRGASNWQTSQVSPFNQAVQYSESYDGNGNDQLFLRNSPVISVQSVIINGLSIPFSQGFHSRGYEFTDAANQIVLRQLRFGLGRKNVQVQYTAGFEALAVTGELQVIPATAPYEVQVDNLPWLADVGIAYFEDGTPLTAVTTSPQQGQYFIEGSGKYLFNAADAGQQLLCSYSAAGTPEDVRLACTQMVAVNYKRRQWIDQASQSMANGAGTVSYRSWELPPEVVRVMNAYTRRSI
jgi:hypothetical protein